jgi:acyl transferase domain-containing protein
MVQYAMARTLLAAGFAPPDHLLGASLGEFVAAAVAEVAAPEAMLFDLIKQARLFDMAAANAAIPVVSCAMDGSAQAARFSPAYWWQVIRQPIAFRAALSALDRRHPQAIYLDLGPSGNMASFAKYNFPAEAHDRIIPVMTPFGRDLEALETAHGRLSALLRHDL